jgi:hypothetical protein
MRRDFDPVEAMTFALLGGIFIVLLTGVVGIITALLT